jgi:hypothetical protein
MSHSCQQRPFDERWKLPGHPDQFGHSSARDHAFFRIVNIGTPIYETHGIGFTNGPICPKQ